MTIPTAKEVLEQQKIDAERRRTAAAPAASPSTATNGSTAVATTSPASTAVATSGTRTSVQAYLDEYAPAAIVGRMVKFDNKGGRFYTHDDGEPIEGDFTALCDQTLVGWLRFNGKGEAPDRIMGLLYDGFVMPNRSTLGNLDQAEWQIGLDNQPDDPWKHTMYLVLQGATTGEMFTFTTQTPTGRRAVGDLLKHYERQLKNLPDASPGQVLRGTSSSMGLKPEIIAPAQAP